MAAVLRVLSYNIRSLRDDPLAVARVIRSCRPDVVCLQEAPRHLLWQTKRRWLARRCGLRLAVGRRPGGLEILTAPTLAVDHCSHRLLHRYPRLHQRALAIALRNYRNGFGVNKARSGIFAQMYVLGIVYTPDLVLQSLGVAVPNFKEAKE